MILPIGDVPRTAKTPYVNYTFIAANIFVFLFLQPHLSNVDPKDFFDKWAFTPADFTSNALKYAYTLFTSMFLHGDFEHLFGNMLFLWIVGRSVEERLGRGGYFAFYIGAGLVAGLAHYFSDVGSAIPTLGASGAISGAMGAYFVLCARKKIKIFYWLWFYLGVFLLPARLALGFWILKDILLALITTVSDYYTNVALWAHVGGALFGIGLIFLLMKMKVVTPHLGYSGGGGGSYRPFSRGGRRAQTHSAAENPYARYSRDRNLFNQFGAQDRAPTPGFGAQPAVEAAFSEVGPQTFAVIALKPWRGNHEAVIDVVARALGVPFSSASMMLKGRSGILAEGIDEGTAKAMAESLGAVGTPALAVPKVRLIDLPDASGIDRIVGRDTGLTLYCDDSGLDKRFRDVFLIIGGRVKSSEKPGARPVVVDIYVYEPWARFRIAEGVSVGPQSQLPNIRSMISQITRCAAGIPINRGVKLLLDGGDWTSMTFDTMEEFDRYSYWLLQVVNIKNRKWA